MKEKHGNLKLRGAAVAAVLLLSGAAYGASRMAREESRGDLVPVYASEAYPAAEAAEPENEGSGNDPMGSGHGEERDDPELCGSAECREAAEVRSGAGSRVSSENSVGAEIRSSPEDRESAVTVYVCGAVRSSGVYTLPAGSRAADALRAAGGFTPDACESALNLAAVLQDGIMLFIPTAEEAEAEGSAYRPRDGLYGTRAAAGYGDAYAPGDVSSGGPVDINSAGEAELMSLPGIGSTKAGAIISYREENGGFREIEDIMKVPGIKEGAFERIRERITVRQAAGSF